MSTIISTCTFFCNNGGSMWSNAFQVLHWSIFASVFWCADFVQPVSQIMSDIPEELKDRVEKGGLALWTYFGKSIEFQGCTFPNLQVQLFLQNCWNLKLGFQQPQIYMHLYSNYTVMFHKNSWSSRLWLSLPWSSAVPAEQLKFEVPIIPTPKFSRFEVWLIEASRSDRTAEICGSGIPGMISWFFSTLFQQNSWSGGSHLSNPQWH